MASLREDKEYQTLKQEVRSKEISAGVMGGISTVAITGAFILGTGGFGLAAMPALAIGAGLIGAATGFASWKQSVDVSFDREELNARRNAVNLSHALGDAPARDKAIAYNMGMDAGRADGKSWAEAEDQRRSVGQSLER